MSAANQHNDAVVAIRELKKSFGGTPVLKGMDLHLLKGENLVVLGKSGCGKSVLAKLIVGLLDADSGAIEVFGQDVTQMETKDLNELRKKIGFLFQSGALYDSMSVRENMLFPLRRIKKEMNENEREKKIVEVLDSVGLADAIDKMPSELSGGMRKRIGLARTIVVDPVIMLYDEPTTGLDPSTSDEISDLILEVQKNYKTTSLIITHDMPCARKVSNRVVMLKEGNVYKEGRWEDFETSDDPEIQSFVSQL